MRCVRVTFLVVTASWGGAAGVQAQPAPPINIPLQLVNAPAFTPFQEQYRLVINVGINGGSVKPYLFDTGSALFNAQYNQAWWGDTTPGTNPATGYVPNSTVPNGSGVEYCYGSTNPSTCRGFQGNVIRATQLDFYSPPGTAQTPPATLTATPGYQISAVYNSVFNGVPTLVAGTTAPMQEGIFYGVFGAGNFTTLLNNNYTAGSVLDQTTVSGAGQGYVVAANGQPNPFSIIGNPPVQSQGQTVTIGNTTKQVTNCSPCVTLGVTPQMLGQFAPVVQPTPGHVIGMVRWVNAGTPFSNPYGGSTGNNASEQFGYRFQVSVTNNGTTVTTTPQALLDTGTGGLTLSTVFNQPALSDGSAVLGGSTLSAIGATGPAASATPVTGLPASVSILQSGGTVPINYVAQFDARTPGSTNTLGLPFFLQNSVLFDLDNKAVGYTPFFVADAPISTAAGPLTVTGNNVPLGLAGVISGPGGLQINGGAVQLSNAFNTYSGPTSISSGQLLISGPGSIASSSSVQNTGLLDISRAWGPVKIQSLSGSTGIVSLGGNNLIISNANGYFGGTLTDGGYYPGTGGSLTLNGGTQVLSGVNSYTGGTTVNGGLLGLEAIGSLPVDGALTVNGGTVEFNGYNQTIGALAGSGGALSLGAGNLTVDGNSSTMLAAAITGTGGLTVTGGGRLNLTAANTYTGPTSIRNGKLAINGSITSDVTVGPAGELRGSGVIFGNVNVGGTTAPGNSIGTLNVAGSYTQAAGSTYQVKVNTAGQSDLVNVTGAPGTATINGGVVNVLPESGVYTPGTTYKILSASGGVTGTYAGVGTPLPFLQSSLAYDANNVYLTLKPGGFARGAQTPNQMAVGGALDRGVAGASGDFATVVGTMAGYTLAQG